MIVSGSCATTLGAGWTEVASLSGKFPLGTVATNADIGGTGGSTAYTPAGTNTAPALTMNAYTPAGTVAAPVFTGTQASLTHTATATTNKLFTGNTSSGVTAAAHSYTPQGTNTAPAFTGTPATLTGTIAAPVFTGSAATITPPYVKVIFCQKT